MDEQMGRWMNGKMDRQMKGWMDAWMAGWTNGRRTDELIDGCTGGKMGNGRTGRK
jgi:hypothetical protein